MTDKQVVAICFAMIMTGYIIAENLLGLMFFGGCLGAVMSRMDL